MKVVLRETRIAFPRLYKAEPYDNSPPRYSAVFLIKPGSANDKAIQAAIAEVAKAGFGASYEKHLKALQPQANKYAYQDGDIKSDSIPDFAGMMLLSAGRKEADGPPAIVDQYKQPLQESSGRPYSGCYVNASVDLWCQSKNFPGIRCSLNAVQFVRDGDAFGTAPANADDFEEIPADLMGVFDDL